MPHSTKDPGAADTAHGANSQEDEGRYIATDITGKQAPNSKPPTYSGNLHQLPSALAPLLTLPHWVLWRWELVKTKKEEEKWTKVPYQPNGTKAKSNDPKTWSSYSDVIGTVEKFDGIGFCLFNSEFAAFDVDDCRDPTTGNLDPWALDFVARAASYTEITVSGTGLRIIGRGTGPRVQRKQAAINGITLE